MQSPILKYFPHTPHFSLIMSEESNKEKIFFFTKVDINSSYQVKVFFTSSRLFIVHCENRVQKRVEVRHRYQRNSLSGETARIIEEFRTTLH
jgi:hypothetical protein